MRFAIAIVITIAVGASLFATPAAAKPVTTQLPCWMIRSLVAQVGGEALAEQVALARGYTPAQIAATKKRCKI